VTILVVLVALAGAAAFFALGWRLHRQSDRDSVAVAETMMNQARKEADIAEAVSQLSGGLGAMNKTHSALSQKVTAMDANMLTIYNALSSMGALSVIPRMDRSARNRPRATGEPPERTPPALERGNEPDESLL